MCVVEFGRAEGFIRDDRGYIQTRVEAGVGLRVRITAS